jgi:hypothetical protein
MREGMIAEVSAAGALGGIAADRNSPQKHVGGRVVLLTADGLGMWAALNVPAAFRAAVTATLRGGCR